MNIKNFAHVVEVDEEERLLSIYRVDGEERILYTSVQLPNISWDDDPEGVKEFCRTLGENIIIDSPVARKLLGI